jgi:hypothetical protein
MRQLAAHGGYSISAECWTEIFDIFEIFCCIPVFLFIYSTTLAEPLNVFCGTPMVPQNCACKTVLYVDIKKFQQWSLRKSQMFRKMSVGFGWLIGILKYCIVVV